MLDKYYHEADALAKTQNKAMDAIEELGTVIDDHDTLVNIFNHVQNPCMQVTMTPESMGASPCFPRDEEARVRFDNYIRTMEDLSSGHSAYMEKLWQLQQVCTNQNTVIDVMNNVFFPLIQVTVTSRNRAEAEEGKTLQEQATSCHTPNPQGLPPNCSESMWVLVSLLSFVLQRQIAGQPATAATCAENFKCDANIMEQLTSGKKDSGKGGKGAK